MKKPLRILLSQAASDHLTAAGEKAFAIAARDMSGEHPGRWVIHLAPVEWPTACAASSVLMGTMRAAKIRTKADPASPSTSDKT